MSLTQSLASLNSSIRFHLYVHIAFFISSIHFSCTACRHEDTDISDDSYSTISVNTTTDTSFHDSSFSSHSSNRVNTVDEDEDATMDDDELSNSYSSTSTQYSTSSSDSNSSYSDLSGYSPISSIPDDTGMTTSYYYSPARSIVSAIRNTLRWHR